MPPAAATATVAVLWGKGFEPARVAVRVGATVTWKRARASTAILDADVRDSGRGRGRGSEGPDADPDAEPTKLVWIDDAEDADEHEVSSSRTFSRTFRRAGRYEYQCGNLVFMRGVVDVVDVDADVAEAEAEDSSSREGSGSDAGGEPGPASSPQPKPESPTMSASSGTGTGTGTGPRADATIRAASPDADAGLSAPPELFRFGSFGDDDGTTQTAASASGGTFTPTKAASELLASGGERGALRVAFGEFDPDDDAAVSDVGFDARAAHEFLAARWAEIERDATCRWFGSSPTSAASARA